MSSVATDIPRLPPQSLEAEQLVLGAILLDNAALAKAKEVIAETDFYRTSHQKIFRAILDLSEQGVMIDQVTLSEHLKARGELESVGGSAALAELIQATPSAANVRYHCKIIQENAARQRVIVSAERAIGLAYGGADLSQLADHGARIQEIGQSKGGRNETGPCLEKTLIDFRTMQTLDLPQRARHLAWLSEGGNVMVFGPRGVGKTMLQLALAAALSTGTDFLKWPITAPVGVLYIDGEMMLDELRSRMTALLPSPPKSSLFFLTSEWVYHTLQRDLVLTGEGMRDSLTQLLDAHPEIRAVILDNISCLFAGLDEDKKRDWEPINAWLIRLRHRGLATVLVHHAGKGGQQRGTSGREDSLDTVIQLDRPSDYDPREGCHFELKFTKCRSVKGEDVAPLDVKLVEQNGQLTWTYKPLEQSKEDQVRALLGEGMTSPSEIAEAVGIDRSYAWKLKRKIEKAKAAGATS